jgi:hypothetical protein
MTPTSTSRVDLHHERLQALAGDVVAVAEELSERRIVCALAHPLLRRTPLLPRWRRQRRGARPSVPREAVVLEARRRLRGAGAAGRAPRQTAEAPLRVADVRGRSRPVAIAA